jgi:hypothetical protein
MSEFSRLRVGNLASRETTYERIKAASFEERMKAANPELAALREREEEKVRRARGPIPESESARRLREQDERLARLQARCEQALKQRDHLPRLETVMSEKASAHIPVPFPGDELAEAVAGAIRKFTNQLVAEIENAVVVATAEAMKRVRDAQADPSAAK